MKILVVTLRYPPYVAGGYEILTRDAVEGLRARGHEVTVLCAQGEDFAGQPNLLPWLTPALGGDVDPLSASLHAGDLARFKYHFHNHGNYRACRRALDLVQPDVVHYFNLGLVSLAPVLAARLAEVPTLGYIADPWPLNHWVRGWRENVERGGGKEIRLELLDRGWRSFRDTIGMGPLCVCSEHMGRWLVEEGLPDRDLRVVPPALDPAILAADAELPARAPDEPLRVLCTSSLWEGKGQDVLVAALARVHAEGVPVELVLAGGGEDVYRARIAAEVLANGLGDAVRMTGWIPREELMAESTRSHVLVMPSKWGEPFGLATIEGQAHGLAVVASDAGASPELVEDGVTGLLTPAGDDLVLAAALVGLYADEEGRQRLAAAGRDHARERFTRERYAADLEGALLTVTGAVR